MAKIIITIEDAPGNKCKITCTPSQRQLKERYNTGLYTAAEFYGALFLATITKVSMNADAAAKSAHGKLILPN